MQYFTDMRKLSWASRKRVAHRITVMRRGSQVRTWHMCGESAKSIVSFCLLCLACFFCHDSKQLPSETVIIGRVAVRRPPSVETPNSIIWAFLGSLGLFFLKPCGWLAFTFRDLGNASKCEFEAFANPWSEGQVGLNRG